MMQPNKFGRYTIEQVINNGYEILEEAFVLGTATELREITGVLLTPEQRLKYCKGFICKKQLRGCVPVFNIPEIMLMIERNELK